MLIFTFPDIWSYSFFMGVLYKALFVVSIIASTFGVLSAISGFSAIYIGVFSGTAILTSLMALLEFLLLLLGFGYAISQKRRGITASFQVFKKALLVLSPLILLFCLVVLSTSLFPNWEGLQSLFTTYLFSIGFLSFALIPRAEGFVTGAFRSLPIVGLTLSIFVFISVFIPGSSLIAADRPLGFALLVPMAVSVSLPATNLVYKISPYAIFAAIFLTESRTPSAIAFILVGLTFLRENQDLTTKTKVIRSAITYSIAAIYAASSLYTSSALRSRYLERGDGGLAIAIPNLKQSSGPIDPLSSSAPILPEESIVINTNGRSEVWEWLLSMPVGFDWIWGKGSGYASLALQDTKKGIFDYPHNEFIRHLVDFGFIGLFLFSLGFALLFIFLFNKSDEKHRSPLINAALLIIIALMLSSITDNPFLRVYLLGPSALVIGLAINEKCKRLVSSQSDSSIL